MKRSLAALLVLLAAVGNASPGQSKPEPQDTAGEKVEAGDLILTAPAKWERVKAASPIIMAEFKLPRAEGDDVDGRLTVMAAGGTIDANVDRWRAQFGGKPTAEVRSEIKIGEVMVTTV